jgi:hypothetical protein
LVEQIIDKTNGCEQPITFWKFSLFILILASYYLNGLIHSIWVWFSKYIKEERQGKNIEQFSIVCNFATCEYISMEALTYTWYYSLVLLYLLL